MPAQPPKKQVQGLRGDEHLRAQTLKTVVQGLRRIGHLQAQPQKKPVQGMHSEVHLHHSHALPPSHIYISSRFEAFTMNH
jgi:hypothetical protein